MPDAFDILDWISGGPIVRAVGEAVSLNPGSSAPVYKPLPSRPMENQAAGPPVVLRKYYTQATSQLEKAPRNQDTARKATTIQDNVSNLANWTDIVPGEYDSQANLINRLRTLRNSIVVATGQSAPISSTQAPRQVQTQKAYDRQHSPTAFTDSLQQSARETVKDVSKYTTRTATDIFSFLPTLLKGALVVGVVYVGYRIYKATK